MSSAEPENSGAGQKAAFASKQELFYLHPHLTSQKGMFLESSVICRPSAHTGPQKWLLLQSMVQYLFSTQVTSPKATDDSARSPDRLARLNRSGHVGPPEATQDEALTKQLCSFLFKEMWVSSMDVATSYLGEA